MVWLDQKACETISSADTPELAANFALIVLPLGIGVSGPRRIKSDIDLMYLEILSTDSGFSFLFTNLNNLFTTILLLFVCGFEQRVLATFSLYTEYASTGHRIESVCGAI
ncbi:hypothetical protein AYI69_g4995 [Smittium culicis]|uniref:Uncharacterized protein n=1 Tax=Smittium culicis TaxID=133412 RepID=A0A1R1Y988_9FUNG|nr:hypothetical protein AYI69_g4995 [Smittium culicis]